jgi:predicted DNA-binding transcriptional regulator AlpA
LSQHTQQSTESRSPPRLLKKSEVLAIVGVTYPSLWAWMRAGNFPRSRIVGGRSMWRSDEIDAWLAGLPVRPLKGDAAEQGDAA